MPGQPGAGGRPVQRVSPVGGVIGGQPAHGGPGGMAGGGLGPMGTRAAQERRSDSESRRWDPDNPWETAEGVSPVLEALPERRIDPGPAIGLDR
jgi:hypothetical protein